MLCTCVFNVYIWVCTVQIYVRMYVCMYECRYVRTYVCMYSMYEYMYVCLFVDVNVDMCVYSSCLTKIHRFIHIHYVPKSRYLDSNMFVKMFPAAPKKRRTKLNPFGL